MTPKPTKEEENIGVPSEPATVRVSLTLKRKVADALHKKEHERCNFCKVRPMSASEIVEAALVKYLHLGL